MAEEEEDSKVKHPISDLFQRSIPFVEVICKSSGKTRRFAAGTEAGFAVDLINRKLDGGWVPLAWHIEAVKEGEEPVSFGPTSVLMNYGPGWMLQTVTDIEGIRSGKHLRPTISSNPSVTDLNRSHSIKSSQTVISVVYVAKIMLAFTLIFVLGAIFTLALENLPRLIFYIQSSF